MLDLGSPTTSGEIEDAWEKLNESDAKVVSIGDLDRRELDRTSAQKELKKRYANVPIQFYPRLANSRIEEEKDISLDDAIAFAEAQERRLQIGHDIQKNKDDRSAFELALQKARDITKRLKERSAFARSTSANETISPRITENRQIISQWEQPDLGAKWHIDAWSPKTRFGGRTTNLRITESLPEDIADPEGRKARSATFGLIERNWPGDDQWYFVGEDGSKAGPFKTRKEAIRTVLEERVSQIKAAKETAIREAEEKHARRGGQEPDIRSVLSDEDRQNALSGIPSEDPDRDVQGVLREYRRLLRPEESWDYEAQQYDYRDWLEARTLDVPSKDLSLEDLNYLAFLLRESDRAEEGGEAPRMRDVQADRFVQFHPLTASEIAEWIKREEPNVDVSKYRHLNWERERQLAANADVEAQRAAVADNPGMLMQFTRQRVPDPHRERIARVTSDAGIETEIDIEQPEKSQPAPPSNKTFDFDQYIDQGNPDKNESSVDWTPDGIADYHVEAASAGRWEYLIGHKRGTDGPFTLQIIEDRGRGNHSKVHPQVEFDSEQAAKEAVEDLIRTGKDPAAFAAQSKAQAQPTLQQSESDNEIDIEQPEKSQPAPPSNKTFDFDQYIDQGNPDLAEPYLTARAYRDRLIKNIDELSEIHPDLSHGWMAPISNAFNKRSYATDFIAPPRNALAIAKRVLNDDALTIEQLREQNFAGEGGVSRVDEVLQNAGRNWRAYRKMMREIADAAKKTSYVENEDPDRRGMVRYPIGQSLDSELSHRLREKKDLSAQHKYEEGLHIFNALEFERRLSDDLERSPPSEHTAGGYWDLQKVATAFRDAYRLSGDKKYLSAAERVSIRADEIRRDANKAVQQARRAMQQETDGSDVQPDHALSATPGQVITVDIDDQITSGELGGDTGKVLGYLPSELNLGNPYSREDIREAYRQLEANEAAQRVELDEIIESRDWAKQFLRNRWGIATNQVVEGNEKLIDAQIRATERAETPEPNKPLETDNTETHRSGIVLDDTERPLTQWIDSSNRKIYRRYEDGSITEADYTPESNSTIGTEKIVSRISRGKDGTWGYQTDKKAYEEDEEGEWSGGFKSPVEAAVASVKLRSGWHGLSAVPAPPPPRVYEKPESWERPADWTPMDPIPRNPEIAAFNRVEHLINMGYFRRGDIQHVAQLFADAEMMDDGEAKTEGLKKAEAQMNSFVDALVGAYNKRAGNYGVHDADEVRHFKAMLVSRIRDSAEDLYEYNKKLRAQSAPSLLQHEGLSQAGREDGVAATSSLGFLQDKPHLYNEAMHGPIESLRGYRRGLSADFQKISDIVGDDGWYDSDAEPEEIPIPANAAAILKRLPKNAIALTDVQRMDIDAALKSARFAKKQVVKQKAEVGASALSALRSYEKESGELWGDNLDKFNQERARRGAEIYTAGPDFVYPLGPAGQSVRLSRFEMSDAIRGDWDEREAQMRDLGFDEKRIRAAKKHHRDSIDKMVNLVVSQREKFQKDVADLMENPPTEQTSPAYTGTEDKEQVHEMESAAWDRNRRMQMLKKLTTDPETGKSPYERQAMDAWESAMTLHDVRRDLANWQNPRLSAATTRQIVDQYIQGDVSENLRADIAAEMDKRSTAHSGQAWRYPFLTQREFTDESAQAMLDFMRANPEAKVYETSGFLEELEEKQPDSFKDSSVLRHRRIEEERKEAQRQRDAEWEREKAEREAKRKAVKEQQAAPPPQQPVAPPAPAAPPERQVRARRRTLIADENKTLAPSGVTEGAIEGAKTQRYALRRKFPTRYYILDASQVIASHESRSGNPNPLYAHAESLQPRDRQDTVEWVYDTALNLDPLQILDSRGIGAGPPIIDSRGMVLDGNGRVMAFKLAETMPDRMQEYRETLRDEGARLGFSEEDIDRAMKMENPIVVSRVLYNEDVPEIVRMGNQPRNAAFTVQEQSKEDAKHFDPELIQNLTFLETDDDNKFESFDRTLRRQANQDTLRELLTGMTSGNIGGLFDERGMITSLGRERVRAAAMTYAMGDSASASRVLKTWLNHDDSESIGKIKAGIERALPRLVQVRRDIESGDLSREFDIADDLARVIEVYPEARKHRDRFAKAPYDLDQYFTAEGFGPNSVSALTEDQRALLRKMHALNTIPAAIGGFIGSYARHAAGNAAPANQGSMIDLSQFTEANTRRGALLRAEEYLSSRDMTKETFLRDAFERGALTGLSAGDVDRDETRLGQLRGVSVEIPEYKGHEIMPEESGRYRRAPQSAPEPQPETPAPPQATEAPALPQTPSSPSPSQPESPSNEQQADLSGTDERQTSGPQVSDEAMNYFRDAMKAAAERTSAHGIAVPSEAYIDKLAKSAAAYERRDAFDTHMKANPWLSLSTAPELADAVERTRYAEEHGELPDFEEFQAWTRRRANLAHERGLRMADLEALDRLAELGSQATERGGRAYSQAREEWMTSEPFTSESAQTALSDLESVMLMLDVEDTAVANGSSAKSEPTTARAKVHEPSEAEIRDAILQVDKSIWRMRDDLKGDARQSTLMTRTGDEPAAADVEREQQTLQEIEHAQNQATMFGDSTSVLNDIYIRKVREMAALKAELDVKGRHQSAATETERKETERRFRTLNKAPLPNMQPARKAPRIRGRKRGGAAESLAAGFLPKGMTMSEAGYKN